MLVREPAVAGLFYPAEADGLANMVDAYLASPRIRHPAPKAIIAPHAGYIYSGPIAGTVYAPLAQVRTDIRRVVILGPAHRVACRGLAVSGADAFDTPLGPVWVDKAAVERILALPQVQHFEETHAQEHSLEVQLPFLQRILEDFTIVPIVVGDASPTEIDQVLEALWGGPETLIVISSDLSHYHDYETAKAYDGAASKAIELLQPASIKDHQACGRQPIKGLLKRSLALDLRATTLDLRNSGDTEGKRDRVVGYGGYVFEYSRTARLAPDHRAQLLDAVERTIARGQKSGQPPEVKLGTFAPQLEATRACFVTLEAGGELRGCVGSVTAHQPLISDAVANAYKSAFGDNRFSPVETGEITGLKVSISILSTPRPIEFHSEGELISALRPDMDGVILSEGERRGLFLPQVWSSLPDPRLFLSRLKTKAGLASDRWSDQIRAWRFSTESFTQEAQH